MQLILSIIGTAGQKHVTRVLRKSTTSESLGEKTSEIAAKFEFLTLTEIVLLTWLSRGGL